MKYSRLTFKSGIILLFTLVSCVYLIRISSHRSTKTSFQTVVFQSAMCDGVDPSNSFTQSEIDRANTADTFLTNLRGSNDLLSFGTTNEDSEEFWKNYVIHLIPFIAIGVVIFFLSIICLCCHCCNYACFGRCTAPTKRNKIVYMGCSVIFSILMVGIAVAGLIFTSGLETSYQRASCAIADLVIDFAAGDPTLNWIGLNPAAEKLENVTSSIVGTLNGLPDADEALDNITSSYNQLQADIQAFYQNNKDQIVSNPNSSLPDIIPDYIANLGPETDNTTISGLLSLEATIKYDTINTILQPLSPAISSLKNQVATLNSAFSSATQSVRDILENVSDILNNYNSAAEKGQTINDAVAIAIKVFFIVATVLAAIIAFGVLNTFTFKAKLSYKLMIFTRYLLNIILIFFSLVFAVVYPVTIGAMEICNAVNATLGNQTLFNQYFNVLDADANISDFLTCLYGDGNILSNLGIDTQILDFNSVYDGLQSFDDYANTSVGDSALIPIQQLYINLYKTGQLPVSQDVAEELSTLNTYTDNLASSAPICSQDIWLLNSINCTNQNEVTFDSTDPADFNYGSATCIGFNQFSAYTGSDRYGAYEAGCPNVGSAIPLITSFQTHLSSVATVFDDLSTSLDPVVTDNSQFVQQLNNVIQSFTVGITSEVANIVDIAGNNETGLIANLNCAFVGVTSHHVVDNICIGYLPILFLTSVFVLAFMIATLLGLLPIFFAGKIQIEEVKQSEQSLDDSFNRRYLIENTSVELSSLRL